MTDNDPGQPKMTLKYDFTDLVREEIEPINQRFAVEVRKFMATGRTIDHEMRAFMLHGFIAITGLHPSKCALIMRKDTETEYSYQFTTAKALTATEQKLITAERRVKELETVVDDLRAENRELRYRR